VTPGADGVFGTADDVMVGGSALSWRDTFERGSAHVSFRAFHPVYIKPWSHRHCDVAGII